VLYGPNDIFLHFLVDTFDTRFCSAFEYFFLIGADIRYLVLAFVIERHGKFECFEVVICIPYVEMKRWSNMVFSLWRILCSWSDILWSGICIYILRIVTICSSVRLLPYQVLPTLSMYIVYYGSFMVPLSPRDELSGTYASE